MAIADYTMREIERKAKAGIAMDKPNEAKIQAYNSFAPNNSFYGAPAQPQQSQHSAKFMDSPNYSFDLYDPNKHQADPNAFNSAIGRSFVQTQGDGSNTYHFGNKEFSDYEMNEIAYYDSLKNNLLKQRHDLTMGEVGKGFGVSEDFSKSTLAPLQQQFYEIEDYLLKRYGEFGGRGGQSNDYNFYGLDRGSMGMNSLDSNGFRVHDTVQEFEAQQRLIDQGMSAQEAYQMVRQIDPNTLYSQSNQFTNNNPLSREALESLLVNYSGGTQGGSSASKQTKTSAPKANEQQQLLAEAIERYLKAQKGAIQ